MKLTREQNSDTHDFQEYNGILFHRKKGESKRYFLYSKIAMHIYVWETENGIKKPDGYVVHHLNEDKSMNNITNLVLWTEFAHKKWHAENRSKVTIEKISQFQKGRVVTDETRKKIKKALTGKKHSEERRMNISIAHMGQKAWNKGIPMSEEAKIKLSNSKKGRVSPNKGKKMSEEQKKKLSIVKIGNKNAFGHIVSEEAKRKISAANKGRIPWNKGKKLKINKEDY